MACSRSLLRRGKALLRHATAMVVVVVLLLVLLQLMVGRREMDEEEEEAILLVHCICAVVADWQSQRVWCGSDLTGLWCLL